MRHVLSATMLIAATMIVAPSAQAVTLRTVATLDGAAEAPPNASPGTGSAMAELDTVAHLLRVVFDFAGLSGVTTAAHIHGPTEAPGTGTAGVVTAVPFFPGMPIGVASGSYDNTFDTLDAATYNPAFVTATGSVAAAEAGLAAILMDGSGYLNIHSSIYPSGEIRGFLMPAAVPVPAALGLMLAGAAALFGASRIKRAI